MLTTIQIGKTLEAEYKLFSEAGCGIAAILSVLKPKDLSISFVELGKLLLKHNAFNLANNELSDLKYKESKECLQKEFGLKVVILPILTIRLIKYLISKNGFVIASVSESIRQVGQLVMGRNNIEQGGHLVLVHGYENNNLFLHNSSGVYGVSQENYKIQVNRFEKFFAARGLVIF